jgi:hypothetical protein
MQVEAINSKEYFRRSSVAMKSPAEIGEMKRDLDFCLKELQHASKRIEELEYRNGVLESEVRRKKNGNLFSRQPPCTSLLLE